MQLTGRRLGAIALATILAACGGGGQTSQTENAQAAETVAPESTMTVANTLNIELGAPANYAAPALPPHYDATLLALDNSPIADPVDDKVATLGRVLFYDKRLSVNDTISCASCHRQAQGFGDLDRFSIGFSGLAFTTAHAMRLANLRYFKPGTMFWNRRAASLELQASEPIQHPIEMGFDASHGGLPALFVKMQLLPYYRQLFGFAFGDEAISEARLQRALAHFQRAMVTVNSRWDAAYAAVFDPALPDKGLGLPAPGLSAEEDRGRALFMNPPSRRGLGCRGCHVPPSFALSATARGNGLDAGETTVFKSPSLKNVAQSGAFMHDGRFSTLEQVVEHYNSGMQDGPALDDSLRDAAGLPDRLNLSAADKAALVSFLRALNDPDLASDARFSNPFK